MSQDYSKISSAAISERVQTLMDKCGVKKHKHAAELRKILGLGASATFRKLKGELPWSLDQIISVAKMYEVDPLTLLVPDGVYVVSDYAVINDRSGSGIEHKATMFIESHRISCLAHIDTELELDKNAVLPSFVAVNDAGRWCIYSSKSSPANKILFNVKSINIDIDQSDDRPVIAVVDDDELVVKSLCIYLNEHDFVAMPFYTLHNFRQAQKTIDFDGYVLDWYFDEGTAELDIKNIRLTQKNVPIILMTGTLVTGVSNETEIAHVVCEWDVTTLEKPARPSIIQAELSRRRGLHRHGESLI